MDSALHDFFEKKNIGTEDGKSIEEWIINASSRANQLSFATHNGKYTHSGAKKEVSCISETRKASNDGFFRTGNCLLSHISTLESLDCLGNAASLDVHAFLSLELIDRQTVLTHVEKKSEYLRIELGLERTLFNEVCSKFIMIRPDEKETRTSDLIKQVYFPVEDDYHLLSLLTPSCLVSEMKARIDTNWRYSKTNKEGREARRKNTYHPEYAEFFGLTEIAFGGTKPQNIGVLNNKNGGITYLLPSIPPSLSERTVKLPTRDFFKDCLWKKDFEELYTSLYRIFATAYNSLTIRDARERLFKAIIDRIIQKSWEIQQNQGGWSTRDYYIRLPKHQKIWLDSMPSEAKEDEDIWLPRVIDEMTRWICNYVPSSKENNLNLLGEEEFLYVRSLIEEVKEAFL
ncbi:MAG TPA: type I-F CRISPR-associated protein Csy1 [Sphaerochaeta sp.]|nr:type I-F CRISPR-associated protein Csy1 [Sphaerochaeta sp.]